MQSKFTGFSSYMMITKSILHPVDLILDTHPTTSKAAPQNQPVKLLFNNSLVCGQLPESSIQVGEILHPGLDEKPVTCMAEASSGAKRYNFAFEFSNFKWGA